MKRLVWLLIAIFCTAFAQVQSVDFRLTKAKECCCCDDTGACGMPDCALPPATAQTGVTLQISASGLQAESRRFSTAPRTRFEKYYVRFESRPALAPALSTSLRGVPAASVPLFKAHCSYLI